MRSSQHTKASMEAGFNAVLLSCLIRSIYAITLKPENSRDGTGSFIKCTSVTLECANQPYTGLQRWKYDSVEVAICSFDTCINKNDEFTFKHDTKNGIFHLTIDTVKGKYNSKLFECYDGTNSANVTAKFEDDGWNSYNFAILITVILFFNIVAVIGTVLFCRLPQNKVDGIETHAFNDPENKLHSTRFIFSVCTGGNEGSACRQLCQILWFPLAYFIVGILLTVILMVVTRFSGESVVEVYDDMCCWEILFILWGIYMFMPCCMIVILLILIKMKRLNVSQILKFFRRS